MIDKIVFTIDSCSENGDEFGLNEAIECCYNYLDSLNDCDCDVPLVHYFVANAYSAIRDIEKSRGNISDWDWENDARSKELLHLRKCISSSSFKQLDKTRQCQALTNLANLLSNTGRPIQAIKIWNRAIEVDSFFSMAIFNKALGLHSYAGLLFDDGHKFLFFQEIYKIYRLANEPKYLFGLEQFSAKSITGMASEFCTWWSSNKSEIAEQLKMYHNYISDYDESLGNSKEEVAYRNWCLEHILFINPLNDLGRYKLAGRDICFIPSMTLKVGEGPFLQALYQQMVHEYGSSRYLFYQALQNKRDSHFCMSDIFYVDTSDSPQHGYWIDMIKASFKIIYGIFDKIGTFISKYYTVESKAVYFKTIWYKKQKKENGLLDIFTAAENHVFRGLYWLSKDLMGDLDETNGSEFCVEPAARKIALLRNRMEHGYVRVIDENNHPSSLDSDFAMVITLDELVNKTYDLFSLVREALMCLAMAVNGEEINKTNSTDGHVFSIGLPISKNM